MFGMLMFLWFDLKPRKIILSDTAIFKLYGVKVIEKFYKKYTLLWGGICVDSRVVSCVILVNNWGKQIQVHYSTIEFENHTFESIDNTEIIGVFFRKDRPGMDLMLNEKYTRIGFAMKYNSIGVMINKYDSLELTRNESGGFAPGSYIFPGGFVDIEE